MSNKIKFQYVNSNDKGKSDVDLMREFHDFLQGELPKGMNISEKIKLSPKQAFSIIWYLQEHLRVFPDSIEMCSVCSDLYDSNSGGEFYEIEGIHYCDSCYHHSEATHCYGCGCEMLKNEVEHGEDYYCKECNSKDKPC